MQSLRALLKRHRHLALAMLVLAFSIKALIPTGYMVSGSADAPLTITICSQTNPGLAAIELQIPREAGDKSSHDDSGQKDTQCAFAGLAKVTLGGADAVLLALAFAYILVLGLRAAQELPSRRNAFLLPPLRGPPATA